MNSKELSDQIPAAVENSQQLIKQYEKNFTVTEEYRRCLPDIQNASSTEILGANVPILQVGISNFRIPLNFITAEDETFLLETSVTGTVSLSADNKGINMSRIMRAFYNYKDRVFNLELLEEILLKYKEQLGSSRARIKLDFSYPMIQKSLRSDLEGYQYYDVAYEGIIDDLDRFHKIIYFDYVYSSACPCSSELSEHARENRNIYSIPHSQRSKARLKIKVNHGKFLNIEDLQNHCLETLKTETQVMVKREDEQAFAELNGAHEKFVEDSARLLFEKLDEDTRIADFQVAFAHLESLHSHDAIAVINKGIAGGFDGSFDSFKNLIC